MGAYQFNTEKPLVIVLALCHHTVRDNKSKPQSLVAAILQDSPTKVMQKPGIVASSPFMKPYRNLVKLKMMLTGSAGMQVNNWLKNVLNSFLYYPSLLLGTELYKP